MGKVMIEVGDLERLKKAIAAFESGHTVFEEDEKVLVALAKRVVEQEEKIQKYIEFPVDIDSYQPTYSKGGLGHDWNNHSNLMRYGRFSLGRVGDKKSKRNQKKIQKVVAFPFHFRYNQSIKKQRTKGVSYESRR